jgi:hypothetical protein
MRCSRTVFGFRLALLLSLGATLLLPGTVNAQLSGSGGAGSFQDAAQVFMPIFEQYDDCTGGGPASQQFPDFGDSVLQSADDFNVSGTRVLSQVVALGSFSSSGPMGPITFEIYDIDGPGNLPGTLICSEVGLVSGGDGATIDVTLDCNCELGSGAYWLSIYPVMSFTDFGQWFWSSNSSGYGSEFAFQDPDALVGNPCSTWGLGGTDCGVGATFPNLCFGIGQDYTDGGEHPIPATGPSGAIALVLIVMLTSLFYLRRNRKRGDAS